MTHAERCTQYALDIAAGIVPACHWIKLAAARHLENLERPDFPYIFDANAANRACEFIELLPHVKGRWAARREKLKLEAHQCFIVCSLFGWLSKEDGFRRFREAYICMPRKNGKSPLAAAIGLYMLVADNEAGAEVVCGAGSEKQAWYVFGPARAMVQKTPDLSKVLGITANARSLTVDATGSSFVPVIGRPPDGGSISCGIADEFHEAVVPDLYDTLKTGMVGREQPLLMTITTAGFDTASACYGLQETAQKVLEGSLIDEQLFSVIYTIDLETDWTTEAALWMANPNLGVSVSLATLLHDQQQAVQNATKKGVYCTKHLCVWMTAASAYFNMVDWARCQDTTLNEEDFKYDTLYLGVDLASVLDLSAVIKVYVRSLEGKLHYYVFARHYLPEDRIADPSNQTYQKWAEEGFLTACDGASLDYALLKADLTKDIDGHNVVGVCYDKRYADQVMQELNYSTGVTTIEVPQKVEYLSLPMKALDAAIQEGRVHHPLDPVLAWCLSNVVSKPRGPNEDVYPDKLKPAAKIDGAVALITAMNRAITCDSTANNADFGFFIG
ncbi:MAG: terminase TerL endonuclease subunit [Terracidiphilus sp.]|jgi:phage terminase large subunit-like protein